MRFAVLGGDMRQVELARLLERDGHQVRRFAMEEAGGTPARCAGGLEEAVSGAETVILPVPAMRGEYLNAPLSRERIGPDELAGALVPGQAVLCGMPGEALSAALARRGVTCTDYFVREELTVKNAAATAEGAVEILLREMPVTLQGARVLVTGFGRIGKLLSLKLRALGAHVTCSARKPGDLALIECLGLTPVPTGELRGRLSGFSAVVNTVPALLLDRELLGELDEGCLCLDLASKPGGVDMESARELGVRVIWALGLPGRVAPVTAGAAVRDAIYNIINESV